MNIQAHSTITNRDLTAKHDAPARWMTACCDGCGERDPVMVIIHDSLWAAIAKHRKEFLCLQCMEQRLGRPITPNDLRPCQITEILATGYVIFSRTLPCPT